MKMCWEHGSRKSSAPQVLAESRLQGSEPACSFSRVARRSLAKARAFKAREKSPHQNNGFSRGLFYSTLMPNRNRCNLLKTNDRCTFYSTQNQGGIRADFVLDAARFFCNFERAQRQMKCHTLQSLFQPISLKTNDRRPHKVTHNFRRPAR